MRLIKKLVHPDVMSATGETLTRRAARGIVIRDKSILLLFTERYNDFSFPGGGVADGENLIEGLYRELEEETGARNVRVQRREASMGLSILRETFMLEHVANDLAKAA